MNNNNNNEWVESCITEVYTHYRFGMSNIFRFTFMHSKLHLRKSPTSEKTKYFNWINVFLLSCRMSQTEPLKSKFANFWNRITVFQIKKIIPKISQILQFRKSSNFHYWKTQKNNQTSEIVEFQKLANFQNLTICKTFKISRISNLMVNYHIFWSFEQFKQT